MNATQSITPPNRDAERIVGSALILGGAASSAFAAKTFIATGFAAHLIPIIGSIVGIALMILGSCLFYFSWRRDQTDKTPAEIEMSQKQIEMLAQDPSTGEICFVPPPQEVADADKEDVLFQIPENVVSIPPVEQSPPDATAKDPLDLTTSDKILTGSNLLQWGIIGAGFCAPQLVLPLSIVSQAASLGSEVATFMNLPKDASWLRKAMSIPLLSRAILNYNPWVAGIFQGVSLYNLAQISTSKIKTAWDRFKTDPIKATKAGAVHLFNLASGTAFAANSAGLISLKPKEKPLEETCPLQNPECGDKPPHPSAYRKITVGTVYEDNGRKDIQTIANLVDETHKEYAERWGLKHEPIVSKGSLKNQCTHPKTGQPADCSPYWPKLPRMINWLNEPKDPNVQEEWLMLIDHDGPITNMAIDPYKMVDQLRGGHNPANLQNNASVILTLDSNTNLDNVFPGEVNDRRMALNGGFWLIRKDEQARSFIDKVWQTRNIPWKPDSDTCPSLGMCKTQEVLHEQRGATIVLKQNPQIFDKEVTVIKQRDLTSPTRGHIGVNTSNRSGCLFYKGNVYPTEYELGDDPSGNWEPGDFMGQPNGVPAEGKDLPKKWGLFCTDDPNAPLTPVRENRIRDMIAKTVREGAPPRQTCSLTDGQVPRKITIGATYNYPTGSKEYDHTQLSDENHRAYAEKHGIKHEVIRDGKLIEQQCLDPLTQKQDDCAGYWLKIAALKKWLEEPRDCSAKEEWRIVIDDDMVLNNNISPSDAINRLREGSAKDASIIIARDPHHWPEYFFKNEKMPPKAAVNTGALIVKKSPEALDVINRLWNTRNTEHDRNNRTCPTWGICKTQETLHEQQGFGRILTDDPSLIDHVVAVVDIRDSSSKTRGHIALNSFHGHDNTCVKNTKNGWLNHFKLNEENPSAVWKKGDWMGQAATMPVKGRAMPLKNGKCEDDPTIDPYSVRKQLIQEMVDAAAAAPSA